MVLNDNECGLILADNSDARVKLIQTTLDSNYLCLLTWTVTLRNTIKGRHISQVMYRKKMRREVLNSVTDRRNTRNIFCSAEGRDLFLQSQSLQSAFLWIDSRLVQCIHSPAFNGKTIKKSVWRDREIDRNAVLITQPIEAHHSGPLLYAHLCLWNCNRLFQLCAQLDHNIVTIDVLLRIVHCKKNHLCCDWCKEKSFFLFWILFYLFIYSVCCKWNYNQIRQWKLYGSN